jgi:hypothetical protein
MQVLRRTHRHKEVIYGWALSDIPRANRMTSLEYMVSCQLILITHDGAKRYMKGSIWHIEPRCKLYWHAEYKDGSFFSNVPADDRDEAIIQ